jgi:endonuclease YncB( thermonuclease family)
MRRKSGGPFRLVKDGIIAVLLLVMGTLIAARVDGINQERFSGRFTAVDGDTIARDGERFRLLGIDAPELDQSCQRSADEWPCGRQAKTYVQTLLQSGTVDCSGSERDRYKRLLVRCTIGDRDLAGLIVAAGYAVTTEYFLFSREQAQAQDRRAGIWSGTFEQPRDWRRENKAADIDVPLAGMLSLIRQIVGW